MSQQAAMSAARQSYLYKASNPSSPLLNESKELSDTMSRPQSTNGEAQFFTGASRKNNSRRRRNIIIASLLLLLVVAGIAIGLAVGLTHSKKKPVAHDVPLTGTRPGTPVTDPNRQALTRWNFNTMKSHGVNLGNHLILEVWMDDGWIMDMAEGNTSVIDEWTFLQALDALGKDKTRIMLEHYDTWITEDDVDFMYQHGVNHVRIPVGFWGFIPTIEGEPYLNMTGTKETLDRILPLLAARGIHADIDLHGAPGSQAPDAQTTGHQGDCTWFEDAQQQRTRDTIIAMMDYIQNSPYQDMIASIELANEPKLGRPDDSYESDMQILTDYYSWAYDYITKNTTWKGAVQFHHAWPQTSLTGYWQSFASARASEGRLVMNDHPYPGNFPIQTDLNIAFGKMCSLTSGVYQNFSIPILINEFSTVTGLLYAAPTQAYWQGQVLAYAQYAGSVLWSLKTVINTAPTSTSTAPEERVRIYSFQNLINAGIISSAPIVNATGPSLADGASDAAQAALQAWYANLGTPVCGSTTNYTFGPTTTDAINGAVTYIYSEWSGYSTTPLPTAT